MARTRDDGGDGREWLRKMYPGEDYGIAREIYEATYPNLIGQTKTREAMARAADFFDREAARCDSQDKPTWAMRYRERAYELRRMAQNVTV